MRDRKNRGHRRYRRDRRHKETVDTGNTRDKRESGNTGGTEGDGRGQEIQKRQRDTGGGRRDRIYMTGETGKTIEAVNTGVTVVPESKF